MAAASAVQIIRTEHHHVQAVDDDDFAEWDGDDSFQVPVSGACVVADAEVVAVVYIALVGGDDTCKVMDPREVLVGSDELCCENIINVIHRNKLT